MYDDKTAKVLKGQLHARTALAGLETTMAAIRQIPVLYGHEDILAVEAQLVQARQSVRRILDNANAEAKEMGL